jgi:hypothetical protein
LGRWRGIKKWEIGARNLMKLNIVEKFLWREWEKISNEHHQQWNIPHAWMICSWMKLITYM